MAAPTLRAWLSEGPFSLAMSSGYFGFFAHTGALQALLEAGFRPQNVSGSSAGGLVSIAYAAGVEPNAFAHELIRLQRVDFWDPGFGFGLLKGNLFEEKLRSILPVQSFAETRLPCAVSVFNMRTRRTDILRTGDLASAARATCALPGLFQPTYREGNWLWDGGILDRPGLRARSHNERVLYFHLPSRSAARNAPNKMPTRKNLVTVELLGLPRLGPTRLQHGEEAVRRAAELLSRSLDCQITQ